MRARCTAARLVQPAQLAALHVEGGWSYPVGGRSIYPAGDNGRGSTFSAAFVFNDDFFNVYPRRGDAAE